MEKIFTRLDMYSRALQLSKYIFYSTDRNIVPSMYLSNHDPRTRVRIRNPVAATNYGDPLVSFFLSLLSLSLHGTYIGW